MRNGHPSMHPFKCLSFTRPWCQKQLTRKNIKRVFKLIFRKTQNLWEKNLCLWKMVGWCFFLFWTSPPRHQKHSKPSAPISLLLRSGQCFLDFPLNGCPSRAVLDVFARNTCATLEIRFCWKWSLSHRYSCLNRDSKRIKLRNPRANEEWTADTSSLETEQQIANSVGGIESSQQKIIKAKETQNRSKFAVQWVKRRNSYGCFQKKRYPKMDGS